MALIIIFALLAVLTGAAAIPTPYAWACARGAGGSLVGCPDSTCNVMQANVAGMVLVLSTTSMTPGAGSTPQACCTQCRETDNCNAWVYCGRKEGCGMPGACTTYLTSLSNTSRASSTRGLVPAAAFGRHGTCTANGTYPYATCSLKQVADVAHPPTWGLDAAAEGWISGVVPKPATSIRGCLPGMTEASCRACAGSRAPHVCFACLSGMTAWRAGWVQCVACANRGKC